MIQVFVMVAVALGIAATLAISAVQKTQQIGILKALGMRDRQTGLIFLWEGAILGVLGTIAGILAGAGLIASFSFIPVPFTITIQPDKYITAGGRRDLCRAALGDHPVSQDRKPRPDRGDPGWLNCCAHAISRRSTATR